MKRRQFILSLAGSAAIVGWAGWKAGSAGQAGAGVTGLSKFTRRSWALGTNVNLTVFHDNKKTAEKAMNAAFAELNRVEDVLSLYRPESQLSQLNKTGQLEGAHPYLKEVLERALRLSEQTNGAFDVTVQPLYTLHAASAAQGGTPDPKSLEETLKRIGWKKVQMDEDSITLNGHGTELTLNGIAQGFAADAVGRVLKEHGISHALIDTGEIGTVGTHAQKETWDIGIKHPRKTGGYLALAALDGRCLATSGDYETRFGEGYENHHILDPRSGRSPQEISSVSVAAPTAMEADALSTALFLTGVENGMKMIESLPEVDALFVSKSGKMTQTAGFPLKS